ncbi:MAG: hypothetical protein A2Y77_11020 [Planctomycetes bacterium RBG_13_62_9]|nr:MAG: hypothetical protein A2Y77_11020 [Planctomycetes bacterium RBG_13_62_9]
MIEQALREQLRPIVDRRRSLDMAWRLSVYWLLAGIAGILLFAAGRLGGWTSPLAIPALCVAVALMTIWALFRSRRMQPDYHAVARDIEQQHPDIKALLLAAIEQKPQGPDGRLGYLQMQVIREAVVHATGHDWLQSISAKRLALANLARMAAFSLLLFALVLMWPDFHRSSSSTTAGTPRRGYSVTVTPGDAEVERGTPVVILARFEGRIPPSATLRFGPSGKDQQQMPLTRSLDDPVFGGIIPEVGSDVVYHVEYAGKRTRDYTISVYQSPELVRADARITYPAYTKLPQKVVEDTRQISVVEGSEVVLTFTLNKAVTTARLAPKSGIAVGLSVDSEHPNVLTTSMTATQSQQYELQMADAQGRSNKMPPRFVIDVHKNLPPELKPVFPNNDVAVSPLEELTLEAEVSDDFGLTGYGVTYTLAGAESRDMALGSGETAGEKPQIRYLLAIEDLKAQPDQLLTYYFWADDVGPDGKPRRVASDIYFAEVRPFEEVFRESQSFQDRQNQQQQENQGGDQQNQSGDQLARVQKQIITATWNVKQQANRSPGGIDSQKGDMEVIRESQAGVLEQARTALTQAEDPASAQALQSAARHMETSLDHLTKASESASTAELTPALGAEQSAYQELLKLRQREHQVAQGRNASRANNANSAQFQQQLQQLELKQQENRYETQRLAQNQQQNSRREDLQALNRLRDLARRQNEMSNRLREAEAALRQARDEQQKQEILRELKRLRDEQLEAMRDVDELQQRMESPQNRQRMADARQRLDDSRSQIRESAEALEQGMVSRAQTSATRAQRQLEQMRDEMQRRTSSQFTEEMRNMRDQAQQLDERQNQIADEMGQQLDAKQKTLSGSDVNRELADRIDQQKESMQKLLEEMKNVSEQSEASEPLLSRKLYDTLRETSTENVDKALQATGELLRRSFLPQAQEIERRAGQGIEELRKGVEEAAESVLGDETESLRLARQQLDELIRQANEEAARAGGRARRQTDDPNGQTASASDQQRQADAQQARAGEGQQDRPSTDQSQEGRQSQGTQQAQQGGSPRSPRDGQQRPGDRGQRAQDGRQNPEGRGQRTEDGGQRAQDGTTRDPQSGQWDNGGGTGPLTSEEYRQWSDRLRDVEEMLPEPRLRDEVARVRDRARDMRAEFTRHGKEPQWDLVQTQIIDPLTELRQRVSEKLAQLQSEDTLAPIDRDPVPDRFSERVRTYFENLGQGDR